MTGRCASAAALCLIAASTTIAAGAARGGAETEDREPAYVCVRRDAGEGPRLRVVREHQACRPREERMLLVTASRAPFVANPSSPTRGDGVGTGPALFVAPLLTSAVSLALTTPLLVEATILVDADRADKALSREAVSCAARLDGQPTGPPAPLAAGPTPPSGVGFVDPTTGEVISPPPVDVPDVLWSRRTRTGGVAAGPHEIAIVCDSEAPFRLLGVARLTVLQPLSARPAR